MDALQELESKLAEMSDQDKEMMMHRFLYAVYELSPEKVEELLQELKDGGCV